MKVLRIILCTSDKGESAMVKVLYIIVLLLWC